VRAVTDDHMRSSSPSHWARLNSHLGGSRIKFGGRCRHNNRRVEVWMHAVGTAESQLRAELLDRECSYVVQRDCRL
jgi:hypothetical protein